MPLEEMRQRSVRPKDGFWRSCRAGCEGHMGEIVRALLGSGMDPDMVGSLLQMEDEEVERLADITPSPQHAGKDHFGKGWVPTR